MLIDKMSYDTQNYVDVQGLEKLRYAAKNNEPAALKEVAKQFQAYLFQMALKSMSEANKAMSGGLFASDEMDFYNDLYAKQLSLEMSKQDLGLGKLIEENLKHQYHLNLQTNPEDKMAELDKNKNLFSQLNTKQTAVTKVSETSKTTEAIDLNDDNIEEDKKFASREDFISHLWGYAKEAAHALHIDPAVLLAQAALETSWGKKILNSEESGSTFNLFNIKADPSWKSKSTTVNALEQENGVLKQERVKFRRYESFKDSFDDYVAFIKNNARYEKVVQKAGNAADYLTELQKAGFATDQHYADKILGIFHSKSFNSLINKALNNIP